MTESLYLVQMIQLSGELLMYSVFPFYRWCQACERDSVLVNETCNVTTGFISPMNGIDFLHSSSCSDKKFTACLGMFSVHGIHCFLCFMLFINCV